MRVLITGGAGFIGSHLVDAYLKRGDEVAIIDNFVTGLRKNVRDDIKLYEADIVNQQQTEQAIADFKPEIINHQAAHLSVYQSVDDPQFNAKTNILGLLNIMEAGRKNNLKKIVIASSGGVVYGDTNRIPTPEDNSLKPVSPYGVSKLVDEQYLFYYQKQYNIDWVAMRYSNVYGPRQNPKGETGVIAVFMEKILKDEQPIIFGDGKQTRDYIFVDDVVRANLIATEKGSGPYNIGTGIESNVIEIFNLLQNAMATNFNQEHGDPRAGEQRRSALDITKATKELGWEPKVKLEKGIEETVKWYKSLK